MFGIYMVPQKYAGLGPLQFLMSLGIGVLITTLPLSLVEQISWGETTNVALSFLCGVLWCTGTIGYIYGIQEAGLARASCLKNTTGIIGTIFGIVFLQEFSLAEPVPLLLAVIGSAAIVYATIILAKTKASADDKGKIRLRGIGGSLYAAVSFAVIMIPTKILLVSGFPLSSYLFFKGQGAFIAIFISFLCAERGRIHLWVGSNIEQHLWGILSGSLWTIGFYLVATSTKLIGLAISWPLNQLSTHVAVLIGIILGEFDIKRYKASIIWGLIMATIGIAALGAARIMQ